MAPCGQPLTMEEVRTIFEREPYQFPSQIAAELGCCTQTVKNHLKRGPPPGLFE
ncbi:MAG: hypothetical protein PHT97_13950 [Methanoculleus sp.]|uniref:hypothetical protein n=1 Tax=Methanoculleus sp. TaxID=90427 RepID=UPI002618D3A5|nr:hypothetical protein [Methanoculleus sp.]MDD2255452.1 hypothetical protein [Methanoculleus sp.]MDD4472246.1 hypothetical protein [Methanoculleus sp.]